MKSPAPTSSVIVSATCATSKPRPNRPNDPIDSAAGTQSFVDAYGDGLPRGHDANREADANGEQRRRGDDAGIRRHRRKPRRSAGAHQRCGHDANDSPRERKRTRERHRRQQNPVDEQLPEHAPRASTQRETNRDLVAPRQRARQRRGPQGWRTRPPGASPSAPRSTRAWCRTGRAEPKSPTRAAPRPAADGAAPPARIRATWPAASPPESTAIARAVPRAPRRWTRRARDVRPPFSIETASDGSPPRAARISAKGTMMSNGSSDCRPLETVRRDADHRRRHRVDLDHLADAGTHSRRCAGGTPR